LSFPKALRRRRRPYHHAIIPRPRLRHRPYGRYLPATDGIACTSAHPHARSASQPDHSAHPKNRRRHGLAICRELGDQDGETAALTNLGITLEQPGRPGRTKSEWRVTHEEGAEVYRKRMFMDARLSS
jgi:hypothetical protein